MKIGKVPENVLKRSILKQIHTKREEVQSRSRETDLENKNVCTPRGEAATWDDLRDWD